MATKKLQILDSVIVTDETLTQSGVAADAKSVGDALSLKADKTAIIQSDMNQTDEARLDFVKNKLFGYMPSGGDTQTWDGDKTDRVRIDGARAWKVSSSVPTKEDLANGCTITVCDSYTGNYTDIVLTRSSAQSRFDDDGYASLKGYYLDNEYRLVFIIPTDNYVKLNGEWKVAQIIKEIQPNDELNEVHLVVYVFLSALNKYDEWCLN
jgi:hypothetical protein